ncbi:MFS transporter [Aeromicrobium sp. UC242_57]|uniref:MFS transporter n=1 Tax=Aeromicrobium sp. UC242_57 TaxID=3374624 RepID=UPI0037A06024
MRTESVQRSRSLMTVLILSVLSASVGTSAANVALPVLASAFGGSFADAQWVALAYLIAMTATSGAAGFLGDRMGRPRALLLGTVVFATASVAAAVAPSLSVLVLARAVQGAGAAVMMALPLAIGRDIASAGRTGSMMGLLGTIGAVGTASGPAAGGLLISWAGWQPIFWVMAGLGALTAALASTFALTGSSPTPSRLDLPGVLLLTSGVATYAVALTLDVSLWTTGALLVGATVILSAFFAVEQRSTAPMLPPSLLRGSALGVGGLLNFIVGTVMMSTLVVGPFFLGGALGLSSGQIGLVMAAGPVASACTGFIAGRIVDTLGPARMTSVGLALMTAGAGALALLPGWLGVAGYMAGTVLLAPGYQLFLAANNTAVLGSIDPSRRGVASGTLNLARNIGMVTGASAMGLIYTTAAGTADVTTASKDALETGLLVTYLFAAAALVAATAIARRAASRSWK